MSDPSSPSPSEQAAERLDRRRYVRLQTAAAAAQRWRRFREARAKAPANLVLPRLSQRVAGVLARGKWPGRALMILTAGVWREETLHGLGAEPAPTLALDAYVRAGPDPAAQPRALFDQGAYLARAPELAGSRWAPLAHYLALGDGAGLDPHPLVSVGDYRLRHGEALETSGLSVLQHYLLVGAAQGLDPHPLFDVRHYVGQCEAVAVSGEDPLTHYLREGWRQGLDPHPLFANDWYLERHPEVAAAGIAPLLDYVSGGAELGRDPHPLFDGAWYAERYRDLRAPGFNPLAHFVRFGTREHRDPCPHFDTAYYLQQDGAAERGDLDPLSDYLTRGAFEGLWPAADFDEAAYLLANPDAAATPYSSLEHWARHDGAKPAPLAGSGLQGAAALFDQMRSASRSRDPAAYDLQAYEDLAATWRRVQADRVEQFVPTAPTMVSITGDLAAAARKIVLPAPAVPRVSIIIPAYNNLKFTLECLQALAQAGGLEAAETLVIDDASRDDTAAVLPLVKGLRVVTNAENQGFIRTCNRAAAEARGDVLIFLNNDVQVRDGWLGPLVEALDDPKVGAVAPKMLFPDGRLQEAGARINADGTSEMIGLFQDPGLPRWNVAREVDYASGACLAVRRADFAALDGFDLAFAPAYCEDADLCFRLRERGAQIIYEPRSEIIHHLSITANSIDSGYKLRLATRNQQRFVARWAHRLDALNQVRTIAFHLPQFHAIPENDRWWGAGFTEWTNVTRALPSYRGHYQPHLPADLGFYDLSDPAALKRQTALAARYGLGGFCFYYYWFSGGRRVLETPLNHLLAEDGPDFPFCVCWANENWTRTWDGQEQDVLLAQTYAPEDAVALITDMAPLMARPNYIRVDGRPLLVIYRPGLLPDAAAWAKAWRETARTLGLGEIYLAFVETFDVAGTYPDPADMGFDAAIEFPPMGAAQPINLPGPLQNRAFSGVVSDYRELVRHFLKAPTPGHTRFRGVAPSWDNTARRQDNAYVFHHASPGAFQAWTEAMLAETRRQNFGDEQIVFINAWNEWAEGAHLEPDVRFGHGWLEALRNAAEADLLEPRP
ncbi:MAG: glycoside hydrolase family 99-like domain-containing protein [Phenylobacterium sp.]|uniref:glycoside hydrolase family 99-like domain-containing protein n=1 Tax=Phenylobacterium sp. TaxID=1871053 RepID=UPI002733D3DD|nr:glycoside hydrolase family 99-like domain-containing protein [Phenylobacterium sp.]MDP3116227.1 glycoside hydrolase family 99-like domain-containing protein [Phenylobacterium sp.]